MSSPPKSAFDLKTVLANNKKWAATVSREVIQSLQVHRPTVLYIGCCDARMCPHMLLNLPLGQVFVHRNVGNVISPTCVNTQSALQFALEFLNVRDVVITGHTDCAAVRCSENLPEKAQDLKIVDLWLQCVREVIDKNKVELGKLEGETRHKRLVELNLLQQVDNIRNTASFKKRKAKGDEVRIHPLMFETSTGTLSLLQRKQPSAPAPEFRLQQASM